MRAPEATRRPALPGAILVVVALLLIAGLGYGSWWLRQVYVEPSAAALACNATPHPGWCAIRFALLVGQRGSIFGVAAVATAAVALFRGGHGAALAAIALAVVAIVNYNVEMGALALVVGLVAGLRAKPAGRPRVDASRA
jgi:hypothetical protein